MLATRWATFDAALAPSVGAVRRICNACLDRLAARTTRCTGCALPLPAATCGAGTREPPPFDAAPAAVDDAAPWDRLVTAFKFRDAIDLARRSRARSRSPSAGASRVEVGVLARTPPPEDA